LAEGLASGAIFVLALLGFRNVRKSAAVEVVLVFLVLGAGALTFVFWEPFAQVLTGYGDGEPIAMLQGVSVWPTVLLRGLGITLALYFIWRALRRLHRNLAKITDDMNLEPKPASLWKQMTSVLEDIRSLWKKITGVFDSSRGSDQAAQPLQIEAAWEAYIRQERFWRRFVRASLCTIVMFAIVIYVLIPLFGRPTVPTRSELAASAYWWTTRLDVVLMQFLTFFVFDATCFCLLFVN
jgi:hypothetical protein